MKTDPRGADRRGSTGFGADIGYDAASDAPAKPKRLGLGLKTLRASPATSANASTPAAASCAAPPPTRQA